MVSDEEFLSWVADRLVYVHGDHRHVDFVHHLREIAARVGYTGINDYKSNEIYKGNILFIPTWQLVGKNPHAIVKWQKNFKIETSGETCTYVDCFIVESSNHVQISLRACIDHIHTDSYVVGNICNNPDLFEKDIQIHDKVAILPSNIKWLRDRCGKEYIVHDIKEEKGRKLYKLSFTFTWITEDQIEKVVQ